MVADRSDVTYAAFRMRMRVVDDARGVTLIIAGVVAVLAVGVVLGGGVACGGASDGYRKRGLAFAEAGRVDAAIEELRLAVGADPGDAAAHAALGRLERRAGRPGAALRHLDQAVRIGARGAREELAVLLRDRA